MWFGYIIINNYENNEDLARGLLILFLPFRDEIKDIHSKDVEQVLFENNVLIEENRRHFEKYKMMEELISSIQRDADKNDGVVDEDNIEESEDEI